MRKFKTAAIILFITSVTSCSDTMESTSTQENTQTNNIQEKDINPSPITTSEYVSSLPDNAPSYQVGILLNTPFTLKDDNGVTTGYDIDLIRAIGEEQGFKVNFKLMKIKPIFDAIEAKSIDFTMSGLSLLPQRQAKYATSNPYSKAKAGYMVLESSSFQSVQQLDDKRISVPAGSSLQNILTDKTKAKIVEADSLFLSFQSIFTGDADATFGMQPNVIERSKRYDNKSFNFIPLTEDVYTVIYAHKDSQKLINQINEGLETLKVNGKYQQLNQKWFGENSTTFAIE